MILLFPHILLLKKPLHTLLMFCCCCFAVAASSQRVTATIDRDKILIGEQIILELRADNLPKDNAIANNWFNIPDSFNHFEVAEKLLIDTIKTASDISYVQKIKITSFDSGYWQIPSFVITLSNGQSFATSPHYVNVLPVDVSGLKDYHDIKDILEVELKNDWSIIIGLIVAALISLIAVAWFVSRRKHGKPVQPDSSRNLLSPYEFALKQLEELQKKQLPASGKQKAYYAELVTITKNFADVVSGFSSTTKTTDEFILKIKGNVGNEPAQYAYIQMLRLADAVKFAKFVPDEEENTKAFDAARAFIHTYHQYHFKS